MRLLAVSILFLLTIPSVGQMVYSEYTLENLEYEGVIIQNSLPKGGQMVSDGNGNEYVYVIFWSRIYNDSDSEVRLQLDFPKEGFSIPSSPGIEFHLFLPEESMTTKMIPEFNYGLDIDKVVTRAKKSTELKTVIGPGVNHILYVVALSSEGVNGTVRAEFKSGKENLVYNLNGFKFDCGSLLKLD